MHSLFLICFVILFIYFVFGCARSLLLSRFFSRCSKQGLLTSFGVWASHRGATVIEEHRL